MDPLEVLRNDDVGRLPELLPIRYGRMVKTPFTFYRGAASIMARDLQSTPRSGIVTQICGDAHLANFGAYASPERRFVFDVNDFDETTPGGAWEWDVKRLTASFIVAGRSLSLRPRDCDESARAAVRSYRQRMNGYAGMAVLDIWYSRIDEEVLADAVRGAESRAVAAGALENPSEASLQYFPKIAVTGGGPPRIADKPPLVFHPTNDPGFTARVRSVLGHYARSMPSHRRALVERFEFADAAYKVVGVGSVGTRCEVALMVAASGEPLFLQLKEARQSVYAPFTPKLRIADCAERVVSGQCLMQAATDVFIGWAESDDGHYFYVRQLRDLKMGADIEHMRAADLKRYANICGWALARAHAKASGTPAAIAGYLGKNAAFDDAIVEFANAYADQNERDHAALVTAVDLGTIPVARA